MSYEPKHAKPTSLMVAVLGGHHDSDLSGAGVPRPRAAADEAAGKVAPAGKVADESEPGESATAA
jgi:hypothetical protein